jgi:hypothetical protein
MWVDIFKNIKLIYCVRVCVCVCVFAYSSRTEKPICTKLGILIPWDQEEILEGSKLRKIVLSSSPGEDGSCSSETKHNRRTASRSKLFVSKKRLQQQRSHPRIIVLGSSPGEDYFYSSETKHDRRTAERTKLFASAGRLQELRRQTENLSWVRISVKRLCLGIIIILSYDIKRYASNDEACDKLSGKEDW